MKIKNKNFIIPLIVYPFDVMISLGETDGQLKGKLKPFGVEWSDDMQCIGIGRFCMNEQNQSIIRLKHYPKTPQDYGCLQHEIFHCVTHLLNRMGMKLVLLKSDEAYAYLVGYLTEEIYKRI